MSRLSPIAAYILSLSLAILSTGCFGVGVDPESPSPLGARGQACGAANACDGALGCFDAVCSERCVVDDDCRFEDGEICRMASSGEMACLTACDDPENPTACGEGFECVEGLCLAGEDNTSPNHNTSPNNISPNNTSPNTTPANNTSPGACDSDAACRKMDPASICEEGMCVMGCRLDDDCASEHFCDVEKDRCVPFCDSDEACGQGEECQEIDVAAPRCVVVDSCEKARDPDAFCEEELGLGQGEAACSVAGCVQAYQAPTTAIQILDLTSGPACEESRDGLKAPGADIIAIELLAASGESLAWGKVASYTPSLDENDFPSTAHLDGLPAAVDLNACPEPDGEARFRQDSVVSLGCGGDLIARFPDPDSGEALELVAGMQILVMEYAPVCDMEGADAMGDDLYEVYSCQDDDDDGVIGNAECLELISDPVGGFVAITIEE